MSTTTPVRKYGLKVFDLLCARSTGTKASLIFPTGKVYFIHIYCQLQIMILLFEKVHRDKGFTILSKNYVNIYLIVHLYNKYYVTVYYIPIQIFNFFLAFSSVLQILMPYLLFHLLTVLFYQEML